MADQRMDEADQPHADPAAFHDQPCEDEKGNREENVIPGACDHGLREHEQRRRAAHPQIGSGREHQDEATGTPANIAAKKRTSAAMIEELSPRAGSHDP